MRYCAANILNVINKMADVFLVNFSTGEPWYLAKLTLSLIHSVNHEYMVYMNHNHYESCRKKHGVTYYTVYNIIC